MKLFKRRLVKLINVSPNIDEELGMFSSVRSWASALRIRAEAQLQTS